MLVSTDCTRQNSEREATLRSHSSLHRTKKKRRITKVRKKKNRKNFSNFNMESFQNMTFKYPPYNHSSSTHLHAARKLTRGVSMWRYLHLLYYYVLDAHSTWNSLFWKKKNWNQKWSNSNFSNLQCYKIGGKYGNIKLKRRINNLANENK